jgi:hypothetical protein
MKPTLIVLLAWVGFPLRADLPPNDPSPTDTTPLGKYRCYTHDLVSPLWYAEMNRNNFGAFRYSEVRIRVRVHADGTLSDFTIVVGDSAGLLKTVSLNVLQSAAPFKPFGDDLIHEMGKSYMDDFDFKVVRKSALNRDAERQESGNPTPLPSVD